MLKGPARKVGLFYENVFAHIAISLTSAVCVVHSPRLAVKPEEVTASENRQLNKPPFIPFKYHEID